jgi:FkbM family methyltransferase
MTGATQNIYTGLHEFEDMAFVLHALRENDVFVDIGANIGSYTVLAGAVVGARCIAFEPIPTTYHHLIQNINLNGISKVVDAQNSGIGSEDGELKFTSGLDTVNHVITESEDKTDSISVPVKSLDSAVGGQFPTIIKIDVEGFESNVIEGASEVLAQESLLAVVMELNGSGSRYGFDERILHKKMLDFGFETFTYSPFARKLIPLNGKNMKSSNTLYLKNREEVQSRVKSARPFSVNGQRV